MSHDPHNAPVPRRIRRIARNPCCVSISEASGHTQPEPEITAAEMLESELLDAGLDIGQVHLATLAAEKFCQAESCRRAGIALRHVLLSLAGTRLGKSAEFIAVLTILTPETSIRKLAAEAGLSQQSVSYHVPKMRKFLSTIAGGDER